MSDHDELLEDLERCADDGHSIVGNTLRCTCGHVDWTTPEVQVLSDAMCRHSITGYWEEKAWEVLQDLAANGWRLVAGSATRPEPLWIALVEDVWRDDDDRVVARLRRTDEGNGTLPTGRSVEVHEAVAGSATPTQEHPAVAQLDQVRDAWRDLLDNLGSDVLGGYEFRITRVEAALAGVDPDTHERGSAVAGSATPTQPHSEKCGICDGKGYVLSNGMVSRRYPCRACGSTGEVVVAGSATPTGDDDG